MGKGKRLRETKKLKREQELHKAAYEPSAVMALCPATDKYFDTGVHMPPMAFETTDMSDNNSTCPHCRKSHRWGDMNVALGN